MVKKQGGGGFERTLALFFNEDSFRYNWTEFVDLDYGGEFMTFIVLLIFSVFCFTTGVTARFWIAKMVFDPTSDFDEKKEMVYTVLSAAGLVFISLIFGLTYHLSMIIAILPGALGITFGEKVYYGWEDLQKQLEDEQYRRLNDPYH